MSFVGGQDGGKGNGNDNNNPLNDWLPDPSNNRPESESDKQTRKKRADSRLPISFRSDSGTRDEEFQLSSSDDDGDDDINGTPLPTSALEQIQKTGPGGTLTNNKDNPYLQVVSALSPSEIISRFTLTAHPRVQEAAKQTILSLIGALPKMAFETTTYASGAKLASLMFQLEMTGYMFKNAEYRLALSREFGSGSGTNLLLGGTSSSDEDDDEDVKEVRGKLKVNYEKSSTLTEMEVDASAFTSELRTEVQRLKQELKSIRTTKEDSITKDLLTYIRTLPPQELSKLTNTMSDDVLEAMKGLVNAVMIGVESDDGESVDPSTVMEQSSEAMAQLCMWQLVVGYNLRELEVREEMKAGLLGASTPEDHDDDDDFTPGLETGGME